MPIEILAALIALTGVVISVVASFFISMRQTKLELQKLRTEIQRSYSDRLLEKRLESYPKLYHLLSEFSTLKRRRNISKDDLTRFQSQVDECHPDVSFLFSAATNVISYRFNKEIERMQTVANQDPTNKPDDSDFLEPVFQIAGEFELALKSDVGIYVVEFSDRDKRIKTYGELQKSAK